MFIIIPTSVHLDILTNSCGSNCMHFMCFLMSFMYFYLIGIFLSFIFLILVYLNGNNAAEGENNIKYANSYPMN